MNTKNPVIAVTHGDTNGIGYELILKSFADNTLLELFTPVVYGSPKVAAYHRKVIDIPANFTIISDAEEARHNRFNLLTTFDEEVRVVLGTPSPEAGVAAFKALRRAVDDMKNAKVDALVLSPTDNTSMQGPDYQCDSEKSYVEMMLGEKDQGLLMHIVDDMFIASLTDHKALSEVASAVTADNLGAKLRLLHRTLQRDFGISDPRIAVMPLNDCDANRRFYGNEETDVIAPLLATLEEEGMKVYGPCTFDDLRQPVMEGAYDAVLAMYEGQATLLAQMLTDHVGCQYIAGLSTVVTLVDTGTDYATVGRGESNTALLRQALYTCIDICRRREAYDNAYADPLPKLYHERRDEGEKVRFAVPFGKKNRFAPPADSAEENASDSTPTEDITDEGPADITTMDTEPSDINA